MRTPTKAKIGLAGLSAVALTLVATLPAFADYAPSPSDIVGVGGDTPQFDLAFVADGDALGDAGFNSSHPVNKDVAFLATADGNARAGYVSGSTTVGLTPTVVLRAGESPVQRIPSSGAAITALLADTTKPYKINYVFSASEPTGAQQTMAGTDNFGYLHVVQIGEDSVQIVGSSSSNAPAGLSIADLLSIYKGKVTKWNQLPGNSGGSGDTIIPELPPTSSSIYKTFYADLTTANGNVKPTLFAPTVQQNDPTAITGATNPADAIVPFSSARLKLQKSGYFSDPTISFPGGPGVKPAVAAITGTPGDGTAYNSEVDHYVIFRQSDYASTVAMEPGSSLNWVDTLFVKGPGKDPTPYIDTAAAKADIAAAGTTPVYHDFGNVSSG